MQNKYDCYAVGCKTDLTLFCKPETLTVKANEYHIYQEQWLTVIRHLVVKHATQHSIHI
jgi:hypothetical protein